MGLVSQLIDFVLHIDTHLDLIIQDYGLITYVLLFVIIFCETGLVVTPFLPGDSLLFAVGAFAARGSLSLPVAVAVLAAAAVLGDTANYWIGAVVGPKVFHRENVRFLNRKHLERTHQFYERYGGKTIVIARFVPIVRTFAPFVAGIGKMTYGHFLSFNVIGGAAWVLGFVMAGFWFGNIPVVKRNFTFVIFAIIIVSVLPAVIEFLRQRARARATD
jgi:membrane-associated protein